LANVISAELSGDYRLRLTSPSPIQTEHEFLQSALAADESTNAVVRGADAIVLVAEPPRDADDAERIDYRTRGAYNLLQAAVREGVRHIVYVSSLRMMTEYEARFQVDENWRPLPTISSGGLSDYLGEFTCREFARQGRLNVTVLRLGNVVRAKGTAGTPFDGPRGDPRDVAQGVSRALAALLAKDGADRGQWSVFHIHSDSSGARFPVRKAQRLLGYQPQFGGREP
jgi:nucleoside-diphosphate-sugar epimerase